jgi:hypothetical protein
LEQSKATLLQSGAANRNDFTFAAELHLSTRALKEHCEPCRNAHCDLTAKGFFGQCQRKIEIGGDPVAVRTGPSQK